MLPVGTSVGAKGGMDSMHIHFTLYAPRPLQPWMQRFH